MKILELGRFGHWPEHNNPPAKAGGLLQEKRDEPLVYRLIESRSRWTIATLGIVIT